MKILLKKVLLLFCLVFSLLGIYMVAFFFLIPPQYTQTFQGALLDKVDRLESIDTPKIILIGNSNLAFGMDSELLEKEIGMPVVNLGLNINNGDIVVIAHSNYADGTLQKDLMWITIENHTEIIKILDLEQWLEISSALPDYVFNKTSLYCSGRGNKVEDSEYTRGAFNEYGDNICERKENKYKFKDGDIIVPQIDDKNIKEINELNDYCISNGAVLVIAGYPIADGKYTPSQKLYEDFQSELEKRVNCQVISNFTDYFYPYDSFYDTYLHLTNEGAEERTNQLILDLKKFINKS